MKLNFLYNNCKLHIKHLVANYYMIRVAIKVTYVILAYVIMIYIVDSYFVQLERLVTFLAQCMQNISNINILYTIWWVMCMYFFYLFFIFTFIILYDNNCFSISFFLFIFYIFISLLLYLHTFFGLFTIFLQNYKLKKINVLNNLYFRKLEKGLHWFELKSKSIHEICAHLDLLMTIVNELELHDNSLYIKLYVIEIDTSESHNFILELLQAYIHSRYAVPLYHSLIISLIGAIANMVHTVNKGSESNILAVN